MAKKPSDSRSVVLEHFSGLARFEALGMRLDQTAPIAWSEQELAAFEEALSGKLSAEEHALLAEEVMARVENAPQTAQAAAELSKMVCAATRGAQEGEVALVYPLHGTGLARREGEVGASASSLGAPQDLAGLADGLRPWEWVKSKGLGSAPFTAAHLYASHRRWMEAKAAGKDPRSAWGREAARSREYGGGNDSWAPRKLEEEAQALAKRLAGPRAFAVIKSLQARGANLEAVAPPEDWRKASELASGSALGRSHRELAFSEWAVPNPDGMSKEELEEAREGLGYAKMILEAERDMMASGFRPKVSERAKAWLAAKGLKAAAEMPSLCERLAEVLVAESRTERGYFSGGFGRGGAEFDSARSKLFDAVDLMRAGVWVDEASSRECAEGFWKLAQGLRHCALKLAERQGAARGREGQDFHRWRRVQETVAMLKETAKIGAEGAYAKYSSVAKELPALAQAQVDEDDGGFIVSGVGGVARATLRTKLFESGILHAGLRAAAVREREALRSLGLTASEAAAGSTMEASEEQARSEHRSMETALEKDSARMATTTGSASARLGRGLALVFGLRPEEGEEGGALHPKLRAFLSNSGLGPEEFEKFAESPQGLGLSKVCAEALGHRIPDWRHASWARGRGVFLAFMGKWREESKDPNWGEGMPAGRSAMLARAMTESVDWSQSADLLAEAENMVEENARIAPALFAAMGTGPACELLAKRSEEAAKQAGRLAALALEKLALRGKPAPKGSLDEPPIAAEGRQKRVLKKKSESSDVVFRRLPYGFAGDSKLVALSAKPGDERGESIDDKEALPFIEAGGLAGKLAQVAKSVGMEPETAPEASAAERANGWLALGKEIGREWLGLSGAAWKMANKSAAVGAKMEAAAWERAKKELLAKAKSAAGTEGTVEVRRAKMLSEMLGICASRGLSAEAALLASSSVKPGSFAACEIVPDERVSAMYLESAGETGLPVAEIFESLREEAAAAKRMRPKWLGALLERAEALTKSTSERGAAARMKDEMGLVSDMLSDRFGRFFGQLPSKLDWSRIDSAQRRWHEEAILRSSSKSDGWPAVGLVWQDEAGIWSAHEILTSKGLSEEGQAMRHCVGSYSNKCKEGTSRIVSLRREGTRALTMEMTCHKNPFGASLGAAAWKMEQLRGPCNAQPTKEGAKAAEAAAEAFKATWSARLEEQAQKRKAALEQGGVAAPANEEMEVPGFDPAEHALPPSKDPQFRKRK